MLIQHVKGYPDTSMYIKNKWGITLDTDRETPCSGKFYNFVLMSSANNPSKLSYSFVADWIARWVCNFGAKR